MRGLLSKIYTLPPDRRALSAIEFALTLSVILGLVFVSVRVITMAPELVAIQAPPNDPPPPPPRMERLVQGGSVPADVSP